MKVAVALSGFMRGVHDCISSWENILHGHDFYFFVSTYTEYGFNNHSTTDFDPNHKVDLERVKKEIEKYGKLVSYQHQDCGEGDRRKEMFMRIQESCHHMKNTPHDFVIRMRPDLYFSERVELLIPEENTAYFPEKWGYAEAIGDARFTGGDYLNDQFAVLSKEAAEVYAGIASDTTAGSPEHCIHSHFEKRAEIKIEKFDFKQCAFSRNRKDG